MRAREIGGSSRLSSLSMKLSLEGTWGDSVTRIDGPEEKEWSELDRGAGDEDCV